MTTEDNAAEGDVIAPGESVKMPRVYKTTEAQREYGKKYYQVHKEQMTAYCHAWRKAHPEKVKAYAEKYKASHKRVKKQKKSEAAPKKKETAKKMREPSKKCEPPKKRELLMTKSAIRGREWYALKKARAELVKKAAEFGLVAVLKSKQKLTPEEQRERNNARAREQYRRHPEAHRARMKKYYESHKEEYKIRNRIYHETHREQWKVYAENEKRKLAMDPVARERHKKYLSEYYQRPEVKARQRERNRMRRLEKKARAVAAANSSN